MYILRKPRASNHIHVNLDFPRNRASTNPLFPINVRKRTKNQKKKKMKEEREENEEINRLAGLLSSFRPVETAVSAEYIGFI